MYVSLETTIRTHIYFFNLICFFFAFQQVTSTLKSHTKTYLKNIANGTRLKV